MKTSLALGLGGILHFCCCAQEPALPTTIIGPNDVEQGSIKIHRFSTNACAVRFQYTQEGAFKMMAFRKEHAGKKALLHVGKFESELQLASISPAAAAEAGARWLEHRSDKIFCATVEEARLIEEGMRKPK